jgi:oligoendopeptidase F
LIVFERLLKDVKSNKEKKALLLNRMAESYATIMRQNYFVKFEIEAHDRIPKGITSEGLSDIYFKNLKEQFGNTVAIDPLFRYEWAYIPHIVNSPFYCYAYNFGELLSLALYARYKREGIGFIKNIEQILAYGGSRNPQEVLKEVGVDINSQKFWQGSFGILKTWQSELERI